MIGAVTDSAAVIAGGARRIDGIPKLRGETVFTQDLKPNGLLHIKLVLSSYPSATINGVDATEALEVPGVVAVLTSRDLAKADVAGPDQPLAGEKVYYVGQPIAAVAATSEAAAADGASRVVVDYAELPSVNDPFEAMKEEAPQGPRRALGGLRRRLHPRRRGHRDRARGQAEQRQLGRPPEARATSPPGWPRPRSWSRAAT